MIVDESDRNQVYRREKYLSIATVTRSTYRFEYAGVKILEKPKIRKLMEKRLLVLGFLNEIIKSQNKTKNKNL